MFKMKTLAAVIAFAAAGSANASIILSSTGNSSLVLTVWDVTTQESYIRDLGYTMLGFIPSAVTSDAGVEINFAADPLFTSLFSNNTASNVQWNVTASDALGTGSVAGRQIIGTGVYGTDPNSYSVLNSSIANASAYMSSIVNVFYNANLQPNIPGVDLGNCSTSFSCYTIDSGDLQYAGDSTWGNNWGNTMPSWINVGTLGQTLGFYNMTPNGTISFSQATKEVYDNANGLASWVLAADGSLVYSVPGPASVVPVPAAAWLFGSGLLGLVGVARRRNV